jgi:hypothetical protein
MWCSGHHVGGAVQRICLRTICPRAVPAPEGLAPTMPTGLCLNGEGERRHQSSAVVSTPGTA